MNNPLTFHGGDIHAAAARFNIAYPQWIDLSTGINPHAFPFSPLHHETFTQLPYLTDDFLASIHSYYGQAMIPVAGSQEAIDLLPKLLTKSPVLLPDIGYKAYQKAFLQDGYTIAHYPSMHHQTAINVITKQLKHYNKQHLVIINPNNPSGLMLSLNEIDQILNTLDKHHYLIIDEAFIDMTPNASFLTRTLPTNCIVLRSFGKFFGLAGLRLGFISANAQLTEGLTNILNPWRINGCAQAIATEALTNTEWHRTNRQWIKKQAQTQYQQLDVTMQRFNAKLLPAHALFSSYLLPSEIATKIFLTLAHQGILTRLIDVNNDQKIVRFGLMDMEQQPKYQRLQSILAALSPSSLTNPAENDVKPVKQQTCFIE